MSAAPDPVQREALEKLQAELSARQSTIHFAHCFVASVLSFILLSASMKLVWDAKQNYLLAWGAFVPAALGVVYATLRWMDGRRQLAVEHGRFEEMKALRVALRVDDPSALLPPQ